MTIMINVCSQNKAYKGDKTKEKLIAYMLEVADVVIHELKGDADMMNENKQLLVTYCGFGGEIHTHA